MSKMLWIVHYQPFICLCHTKADWLKKKKAESIHPCILFTHIVIPKCIYIDFTVYYPLAWSGLMCSLVLSYSAVCFLVHLSLELLTFPSVSESLRTSAIKLVPRETLTATYCRDFHFTLKVSCFFVKMLNVSFHKVAHFDRKVFQASSPSPSTAKGFRLGHRGKLEYMLVCDTVPSGGLVCMWLSRGKERAQCAVVFTAPLLNRQLSREQRWRNTDLRQMMKTHGSTMGLRA